MAAPSFPHIRAYRAELARVVVVGGSRNEGSVRRPFANLLQKYCAREELTLVEELREKSAAGRINIPDGTVKTAFRLDHGHWEAKDEKDDLDRAIESKVKRDYPRFNILFENTRAAVLIQDGAETMRVDMADDAPLHRILNAFVGYQRPEIADFRRAMGQFKSDLPDILAVLRAAIDDARAGNKKFRAAAAEFLALCRDTINPGVGAADIREMLIQHILTADIFRRIFDDDQFHNENNIAAKLEGLARTFFVRDFRRNTVDKLKAYYAAVVRAAGDLADRREKEKFLKAVYEDFYRVYNPRAADRLGVVYTPSELVNFMVRAADELVQRHFGRRLWDDRVQILDPATGTGTFVTELIEFFPVANLRRKYAEELHANEVAILPYYIANLNIEHAYKAKVGEYREFPGICFVDTLDNHAFENGGGRSQPTLGGLAAENMARIRRQNKRDISVVIGNPPWNVGQANANDDNPNRKYPEVDRRIKATYAAASAAQKPKVYDMYARFVRWASDRLGANGALAFVTNSSFISAKGFDGFRKAAAKEFNEIRVIDLKGDARMSGGRAGAPDGNIFKVRVGVAVWFFVRGEQLHGSQIWHCEVPDGLSAADKLALLFPNKSLADFEFRSIVPDAKNNWVGQTDGAFDRLLPLAAPATKRANGNGGESALCKLYSLGASTNRDDWVYDSDAARLAAKARFFLAEYRRLAKAGDLSFPPVIKWSSTLKARFPRRPPPRFQSGLIVPALYRPFAARQFYAEPEMSDRLTANHCAAFGDELNRENKLICFSASRRMPFAALACDRLPSLTLFVEPVQFVPLYRYDADGRRRSNMTAWGLAQFRAHYRNPRLRAEDVFHYAYGVLHDPAYREKYGTDLLRELPRLPFYADFRKWANWGKKLMALHLGFESAAPYPLVRRDSEKDEGRAKLRADKTNGRIVVDEKTVLEGVPPEAWEYKLGGRSALEWVLDQHKDKRVKDPTVAAKFPPAPFAGRKEEVIELLRRVCAVSVETMRIIREMEGEQ